MSRSSRDEIVRLELLRTAHPGVPIFTHPTEAHGQAGELEAGAAGETTARDGAALEGAADEETAAGVAGDVAAGDGTSSSGERAASPADAEGPPVVTETMAELYARRGLHEQAAEIYRALLRQHPDDDRLRVKVRIAEVCLATSRTAGVAIGSGAERGPAEDAAGRDATVRRAGCEPGVLPSPEPGWTAPGGSDRSIRRYFRVLLTFDRFLTARAESGRDTAPMPHGPATPRPALADAPRTGEALRSGSSAPLGTAQGVSHTAGNAAARSGAPDRPSAPGPDSGSVPLVDLLIGLLEFRDPFFRGGSSLTRLIASAVGRRMGLDPAEVEALALAALLRDLGRVMLGGKLLERPSHELGPEDRRRIERHVELSLRLLEGVPLPPGTRAAIRHHHERWDGQGYPDRIAGDAIPLPARILAVADALSAMLSPRPFRPPRRLLAAVDELRHGAGTRYDPAVVDAVIRTLPGPGDRSASTFGLRHRTVVVSPDRSQATVLAAKLCGHGYIAETEPDAAAAQERMKRVPVETLIVSSDLPSDGAIRFVRELRETESYAALPIVAVDAGTVARRVALLDAGADVCFPRDVSFDELRATLDALRKRTGAGPGAMAMTAAADVWRSPGHALQGELRDFPLSWLLEVLSYDGRTAVVLLRQGGDEGIVAVENGVVCHARTGETSGEDALRAMRRWSTGEFVVRPNARLDAHTVDRPVVHRFDEGAPTSPRARPARPPRSVAQRT